MFDAARAKTDVALDNAGARQSATRILAQARSLEDRALRDERIGADEGVQDARAEKVARLAAERRETDKDLSSERAESDDVLATRDEVLQIVSHDLRNLLGTIIGMAGLIEEDADPAEGDTGTMGRARWIARAASRMNRLVGDLTDAASIEAGTLALAIPIIIHLFHKSRFKVVLWGAMHLLEAVIRQNQRRIRIEQWILLAIRCAICSLVNAI